MKTIRKPLLSVAVLLALLPVLAQSDHGRAEVFQVSTMSALEQGNFGGILPIHRLRHHGNFGIGTFDGLDGEMAMLGPRIYRIAIDGKVHEPAGSTLTPFAMVTWFTRHDSTPLADGMDLVGVKQAVDAMITDKSAIYAIKLEGEFSAVQTRSVPKQAKPYPTLATAIKAQKIFELADTQGTAIGFWFPANLAGVNAPGYHFHFLTADRQAGGHVLDCRTKSVRVTIQKIDRLELELYPSPQMGSAAPALAP